MTDKDNIITKKRLRHFKSQASFTTTVVEDNMEMQLPLNSDKIFIK